MRLYRRFILPLFLLFVSACLPRPNKPVFALINPFADKNAEPTVEEPGIEEPTQDQTGDTKGPVLSKDDTDGKTDQVVKEPTDTVKPDDKTKTDNKDEMSKDGTIIDPTVGSSPMPVPQSSAVVYRPLGKSSGGYQLVKDAKFPNTCVKGDTVSTSGALFPFNESQNLVLRGPLVLSDLVVYEKKPNTTYWTRVADLTSLKWEESNYGSIINLGVYPLASKLLQNGREVYTQLPGIGEKIVVVRVKMPRASTAVYKSDAQNDVPAVWMLNSRIFAAPSGQYFCNCRGLGNPGGCGELDIAEIIPENKTEVTTTIYSYEGARGGKLSARPTGKFQIYATVLRNDNGTGEVAVVEAASFDFTKTDLSDSFVAKDWLPTAKRLNSGSEALIPPSTVK
ncbi:MAG: hypothetical protein EOP07_01415 [Proteobacteria bacterium]|nr:MAG: hypothetical protein EOP07_01415 [Pseudomonadota bacterium]